MNAQEFIILHVNKWTKTIYDAKAFESLSYTTDLKPKDYLKFANEDVESGLTHSRINALSNAKRAIDCQVDNILDALGMRKGNNFPSRIESMESLGLAAPRIIKKVVKLRNRLEHEYYYPSNEEVEDAIDIAHLFIEATSSPFGSMMTAFYVAKEVAHITDDRKRIDEIVNHDYRIRGYTYRESVFVEFDTENKCFYLDFVLDNNAVVQIDIGNTDLLYPSLVKYVMSHNWNNAEWDELAAAKSFISWLNDASAKL